MSFVEGAQVRAALEVLARLADDQGRVQLTIDDYAEISRRTRWSINQISTHLEWMRANGQLGYEGEYPEEDGGQVSWYFVVRNIDRYRPSVPSSVGAMGERLPIAAEDRALVWDRTGGRCWYCGKQTNPFRDFHADHFVPVAIGGTNDLRNLVPCCSDCNLEKGAADVETFRRRCALKRDLIQFLFAYERMGWA